jgi:DNA-binding CsgD family transcriptional regulator
VSTHKANVLQKMGMSSTGELIRYAIAHKLVEGEPG